MQEDQYLNINLNTDTNIFSKIVNKYIPEIEKQQTDFKIPAKPKYQYKELCKLLAPIYGRRIWTLPSEVWYTDYKLEKAHSITEKSKGKGKIGYLIKVMRNLPY